MVRKNKILTIVVAVIGILVLAFLFLLFVPVKRIVSYRLMVRSSPMVVYKDLNDKENWRKWIIDTTSLTTDVELNAETDSNKIKYIIRNKEVATSEGVFKISPAMDGSTVLENNETIHFRSIADKLVFFFSPGSFKADYNRKVEGLKTRLQEPSWNKAGIYFQTAQMSSVSIAAFSDTVKTNNPEVQIVSMYNKIRNTLPAGILQNEYRPQSRFKQIEGTNKMFLQVGINLNDSLAKVPAPFSKLDVPACKLIIAGFKGKYEDVPGALEVLKDWINKNHLVMATGPWLEHKLLSTPSQVLLTDSIYIIQPVYFWPKR